MTDECAICAARDRAMRIAKEQPTDDMMQCPACHGQAPDFRCQYCDGVGGVTEDRFHAYHDRAMGRVAHATLDEIAAERQRQIIKGYDAAHDDAHSDGSIARAAAVYALLSVPNLLNTMAFWPWSPAQCRPGSKRERLVKAAALCVAEIARLCVEAQERGETAGAWHASAQFYGYLHRCNCVPCTEARKAA